MGFFNALRKDLLSYGKQGLLAANKLGNKYVPRFAKKARKAYVRSKNLREDIGLGLESAARLADAGTGIAALYKQIFSDDSSNEGLVDKTKRIIAESDAPRQNIEKGIAAGKKLVSRIKGRRKPKINNSLERKAISQGLNDTKRPGAEMKRGINPDKLNNMVNNL